MASPTPVLPDVGSTMVPPGRSRPSRSAASTISSAGRSLDDPPGLVVSSFATNVHATRWVRASRPSLTSGVLPMRSSTDSAMSGPAERSSLAFPTLTTLLRRTPWLPSQAMWSTSDVLALAPDEAVAHAARALAVPASWTDLGSDEVGVWGLYRGTSAEPYDVVVDRSGPAWRCSCPSRKLPCKHAIGLLLLWAEGAVPTTVRPAAVRSWLAARAAAAAQTATSSPDAPAPVGPRRSPAGAERPGAPPDRGRQRRVDERTARVRAGLEELDRWLADQVRRG